MGLPRELRTRHNMAADILREQERSNSANVGFRTALGKDDALEAGR
jgi:hypothetical protein